MFTYNRLARDRNAERQRVFRAQQLLPFDVSDQLVAEAGTLQAQHQTQLHELDANREVHRNIQQHAAEHERLFVAMTDAQRQLDDLHLGHNADILALRHQRRMETEALMGSRADGMPHTERLQTQRQAQMDELAALRDLHVNAERLESEHRRSFVAMTAAQQQLDDLHSGRNAEILAWRRQRQLETETLLRQRVIDRRNMQR